MRIYDDGHAWVYESDAGSFDSLEIACTVGRELGSSGDLLTTLLDIPKETWNSSELCKLKVASGGYLRCVCLVRTTVTFC